MTNFDKQHSLQQLPVALQFLLQLELVQVCLVYLQKSIHEGSALVCSAGVPQSRGEARRSMRTPLSSEKGTNFSVGFILARDKF